jgi:hypothetical protein
MQHPANCTRNGKVALLAITVAAAVVAARQSAASLLRDRVKRRLHGVMLVVSQCHKLEINPKYRLQNLLAEVD